MGESRGHKTGKMKKQLLFSYGTLQDPEIQQLLFGFTYLKKNAKLLGWSLCSLHEDGCLFIKPDLSGIVVGSVLGVDIDAIHTADQWEDIPLYRREKVTVMFDDDTRAEAWAYTRRYANGMPYDGTQSSLIDREAVLKEANSLKNKKVCSSRFYFLENISHNSK